MAKTKKSYSELIKLKTHKERFEYLKLHDKVGSSKIGENRHIRQTLYRSYEWKCLFRKKILARDLSCDLGIPDRPINKYAVIHHINPVTDEQILARDPCIFDPENVITTSFDTHNALHYGDYSLIDCELIERTPNDTCLWKK